MSGERSPLPVTQQFLFHPHGSEGFPAAPSMRQSHARSEDTASLAYKKGIPLFILRDFVGACENDHKKDGFYDFMQMSLTQRFKFLKSPVGYNLHNTLLFQKRFFPYRYPFVLFSSLLKVLFPKLYYNLYKMARK